MTLKLSLNNQIHRISKLPTSHKALRETVTYIFGSLLPAKWTLQYLDSDGDTIMLSDETDFRTLLDDELANSSRSVKVFVKILEDNEQMPQNWEAVVVTQSEESQVIGTDEPKIKSEIYIDNPKRLEVSEACCIPAASQNQVDKSLTIEDGTICLRQDYVEPQSNDYYIMKRSLQKLVSVSMKKEKLEAKLAAFGQNMTSIQAEKLQNKMDKYVRQLADEKLALKVKLSEETLAILYRELLADLNKEFTITQKPKEDNIQDINSWFLPIGQSSDRPALITTPNNHLLMLYKGNNDYKVYVTFSSDGGSHWLPEVQINDKVNTLSGPGIAFCYNKYHLVFRGVENKIYYSASNDGFTWDDPIPLVGLTSDSPALTVYNNQLFLAWKGATSDTAMWYSTYNNTNNTWSTQAVISSAFTTPNGPALISYNNTVGLGFRGTDDNLYYATYTNASWSASLVKIDGKTSDKPYLALLTGNMPVMMWKPDNSNFVNYSRLLSTGWTPQVQISTSITTDSGPALTSAYDGPHLICRDSDGSLRHASGPLIYDYFSVKKVSGFFSSDRPALIQYGHQINNQLLTIFKSNSSLRMYYSIYSITDATWTPPTMLDATLNTANAPALIFHRATYHLVYQGSNKPDNIYHSFSPSGTSFKTCYATPFSTSDTPALAVYNDQLVLLWKGGADNDTTMWYSTFDYTNRLWNPQQQLDTSLRTSSGPALTHCNATLHLAYRGTNNILYYTKTRLGLKSWDTPTKIADDVTTSCKPTLCVSNDNNQLFVLWKNANDTKLFSSSSLNDGNTWSAPLPIITGVVYGNSAPACVPGKETSYLLYQGLESDGPLYSAIGAHGLNLSPTNNLRSNHNWMEYLYNTYPNFKAKNLTQIIIPGTHDSGCFNRPFFLFLWELIPDLWVVTQEKRISDQLNEGIRYFDLRFYWTGQSFIIHHGSSTLWWSTLYRTLNDLKSFIQDNTKEFIILHITHFDNFTDLNVYQNFFDQIWNSIGNFLIPNFTGASDTRTIDNLLQAPGRVIISTDAYPGNIPSQYKSNIWNNILSPYNEPVYQSQVLGDIKIELEKQVALNSNKGYLWVAQLIMTPTAWPPYTISELSLDINPFIIPWMKAWKGKINIVIADYYWGSYVDAIVTLNQQMLEEV